MKLKNGNFFHSDLATLFSLKSAPNSKNHPSRPYSARYRDAISIHFEYELVHDKEYVSGEEFFGDYCVSSLVPTLVVCPLVFLRKNGQNWKTIYLNSKVA